MRHVLTTLLLAAAFASAQAQEGEAELFDRAVAHLEAGRHAQAVPLLEAVIKVYPDNRSALWNLGIAYAEVGAHRQALETWQRLQKAEGASVPLAAKVMQAHQALGELAARDQDRVAIVSLWRQLPEKDRQSLSRFCREQYTVGGEKVLAFEYFEPASPNRVFYRFVVIGDDGDGKDVLDIASLDSTTQIAREHGAIGPDARLYHFERYTGGNHLTYAHLKALPSYEEARALVGDALAGRTKSISGSSTR